MKLKVMVLLHKRFSSACISQTGTNGLHPLEAKVNIHRHTVISFFFLQDFYFRINSQINNLAKIPDEGKFLTLTTDLTKIKTRTAESTVWPVVLNTATTEPIVWPVV